MRTVRRLLKLILFGITLFILSVGYRFFGEKRSDPTKGDVLGTNEASADVPGCSSTSSTSATISSTSGTISSS